MTRNIYQESMTNPSTGSRAVRHSAFRMTLRSEIRIAATPKQIWEVLVDFGGYKDWNPAIPSAQGEATRGAMLRVVIRWPGLKPSGYQLKVLEARPQRELRWLGHYKITGLLDGDHTFTIEAFGEDRSSVVQMENFSGILVPLFAPWLRENVLNGFDQTNVALKNRAERSAETGRALREQT